MNGRRILFCLGGAACLVFIPAALGQSENPVPKPPYIAPVPVNGHWTITIKYPTPPSPPAVPGQPAPLPPKLGTDHPIRIDVIRTGTIRRLTLYFQSDPPQQIDEKDDFAFVPTALGGQLVDIRNDPGPNHLYSIGFLFDDWVTHKGSSSFTSIVSYNNVRCFHYQDGGNEAWIDIETMLPVALKQDAIEADYQFLAPPTSPLQLPAEVAIQIQQTQAAIKAFNAVR